MMRSTLLAAASLGALIAAADAARAQAQLEEIVVTARKTTERLQDVPISVSAFTERELAERGLTDIFKISQFTPGFTFEKINRYGAQGGTSRPVIRGMSNILGEGNAAVFVDGVLFTDSILSFPFDVVERVEVIKGPQAALFGRATFSGAINLITKKGGNEFEHKVSARAAEYDDYEINLLSSGPLIEDKAFYMVHGRYYDFGGMYRNTLDGGKVGQEESYGVNASLEFRASDNFTIRLSGGYNEDHDGLAVTVLQDRFSNNCFLNAPRQYYCGKVKRFDAVTLDRAGLAGTEGVDRESLRLFGTLEWAVGDFQITSNTGVFFTDTSNGTDSTAQGATAIARLTIPGTTVARAATDPVRVGTTLRNEVTERDEWSQELRVSSPQDESFRYLFGGFYYKRTRDFEERRTLPGVPTLFFGTDRVRNWAVFGSLAQDFTEDLTGTVELRYARDRIGNNNPIARPTVQTLIQRSFKSWSPRFTLDYKMGDETLIYAVVAKGNKPGVINTDPRFPPDIQFAEEEKSWNYEVGTKNTLLDGKMVVNLAAYYIDWTNQQLTTTFFFPTGGTQSYIVNAGETEVKGLEAEISGVFNEYASGGFTYSFNDAKFKRFNDPEHNELFGTPSARGKQLPNTPKQQFTLYGRLNTAFTDEIEGFARADFAYTERKFAQIYNLAHTGDQYLLNLKVGMETDAWNLTLFVDNVTDDRTPSTVIRFVDQLNLNVPGAPQASPAQVNVPGTTATERGFQYPLASKRKFGVTASYKF